MSYDAYANYASCGPGYFQDVEETQQCSTCNNQLNCSSAELASNVACRKCPTCASGQVVTSWNQCNGSTADPFAPSCAQCTKATDCSVGQYIGQICLGNKTADTQICIPCQACPYGFYHGNHTTPVVDGITQQQACDGKGIYPSSEDGGDCVRCGSCSAGSYASSFGRCTGNSIGAFREQDLVCSACRPCSSGFKHVEQCDGFTFNDTCTECPNCTAGFYKASSWNNATKMMDCSCTACMNGNKCQIHEYRTGLPCTGNTTVDTTCSNCSTSACSRYGTSPNYTNCVESTGAFSCIACPSAAIDSPHGAWYNCSTCAPNNCSGRPGTYLMESQCNIASKNMFQCGLCEGCSLRQYFDSWGFCDGKQIGSGSFVDDAACKTCLGNCKVGQYISKPCTGRENNDTEIDSCKNCTSCPYGYYHATHTRIGPPKKIPFFPENKITEQASFFCFYFFNFYFYGLARQKFFQ